MWVCYESGRLVAYLADFRMALVWMIKSPDTREVVG